LLKTSDTECKEVDSAVVENITISPVETGEVVAKEEEKPAKRPRDNTVGINILKKMKLI